jgi:hypothetical protein
MSSERSCATAQRRRLLTPSSVFLLKIGRQPRERNDVLALIGGVGCHTLDNEIGG